MKPNKEEILRSYDELDTINGFLKEELISKEKIIGIFYDIVDIILPGYFLDKKEKNVSSWLEKKMDEVHKEMSKEITNSCKYENQESACRNCEKGSCLVMAEEVMEEFFDELPSIRELVASDVVAAYDGDPAAKSFEEVILSYPGFFAILTYRIANFFYRKDVPLIPRIISEHAHSITGTDIHPGATVGRSFFIDHATGVVIGETTVIGDGVKLYQGVTLGALSFPKDERGRAIKGGRRHPTIEDGVVVYANATILGGDTVVGKNSVVGGNSWVVKSVKAGTKVK